MLQQCQRSLGPTGAWWFGAGQACSHCASYIASCASSVRQINPHCALASASTCSASAAPCFSSSSASDTAIRCVSAGKLSRVGLSLQVSATPQRHSHFSTLGCLQACSKVTCSVLSAELTPLNSVLLRGMHAAKQDVVEDQMATTSNQALSSSRRSSNDHNSPDNPQSSRDRSGHGVNHHEAPATNGAAVLTGTAMQPEQDALLQSPIFGQLSLQQQVQLATAHFSSLSPWQVQTVTRVLTGVIGDASTAVQARAQAGMLLQDLATGVIAGVPGHISALSLEQLCPLLEAMARCKVHVPLVTFLPAASHILNHFNIGRTSSSKSLAAGSSGDVTKDALTTSAVMDIMTCLAEQRQISPGDQSTTTQYKRLWKRLQSIALLFLPRLNQQQCCSVLLALHAAELARPPLQPTQPPKPTHNTASTPAAHSALRSSSHAPTARPPSSRDPGSTASHNVHVSPPTGAKGQQIPAVVAAHPPPMLNARIPPAAVARMAALLPLALEPEQCLKLLSALTHWHVYDAHLYSKLIAGLQRGGNLSREAVAAIAATRRLNHPVHAALLALLDWQVEAADAEKVAVPPGSHARVHRQITLPWGPALPELQAHTRSGVHSMGVVPARLAPRHTAAAGAASADRVATQQGAAEASHTRLFSDVQQTLPTADVQAQGDGVGALDASSPNSHETSLDPAAELLRLVDMDIDRLDLHMAWLLDEAEAALDPISAYSQTVPGSILPAPGPQSTPVNAWLPHALRIFQERTSELRCLNLLRRMRLRPSLLPVYTACTQHLSACMVQDLERGVAGQVVRTIRALMQTPDEGIAEGVLPTAIKRLAHFAKTNGLSMDRQKELSQLYIVLRQHVAGEDLERLDGVMVQLSAHLQRRFWVTRPDPAEMDVCMSVHSALRAVGLSREADQLHQVVWPEVRGKQQVRGGRILFR